MTPFPGRARIAGGAATRYDALRAVIDGGPFDAEHGFGYGYAFKMICRFHGKPLDNSNFSPFLGSWLQVVDEGLVALGSKAGSVADFVYGSPPAPLPPPEDLPGYDEWSATPCRDALARWDASTAEQRAGLEPEAGEAIEQVVSWLRAAVAQDGYGIAGFGS
ncbi:hypothetical protein [Streptomyces sp. SID3343]|uniref:DUF7691 family protein n=1 Tax=Streptomyces sp. SID3343 TaxID=2690260 RepID=UPI00136A8D3C|nr:hypothetical protein [Streptomyces sp. SID3343]MYV98295.1 hypothetical protein [Streptomyces sp. SID3343]